MIETHNRLINENSSLPPYFEHTLSLQCPAVKQDGTAEPYAEEARFFLESRLLQKDVEVVLESVNNNNFVGTLLHPQGNIAEALLKQGFARCVDWSLAVMKSGEFEEGMLMVMVV